MKTVWFAVCLVSMLAGVAQADPIAYEGLQYAPGWLGVDGPSFGFLTPWMADAGITVVPAGLASPLDRPSAGGAVTGGFNYVAQLIDSIVPLPGKEFWASFLLLHSAYNDQAYMGLSAFGAPIGPPPAVAFGVRLEQYGIFIGGAFTPAPVPYTPYGSIDFLVAHFVAGGASWQVSLYVNPSSFAVPSLVMNVPAVSYGAMVNHNQPGFTSDEFRLGDTAGDVSAAGGGSADVAAGAGLPGGIAGPALRSIAPNPASSETTIRYDVPAGARADLAVLDVRGRVVAALRDDASGEGSRSIRWGATDDGGRRVAPGVYFVRLTSGGVVRIGRVLVVR